MHSTQNNVTTPPNSTSSGQKHHARAVYCCGWLLYRRLRSVIRHHHLSLFCCAVHVRQWYRAAKNNNMDLSKYGQMVTMPDFGPGGASSILADIMSILFFKTFFWYHVRNPDTIDNKQHRKERCKVRATISWLHNAIHTCRPPAEKEATSRVCGSLSALYCCGFLLLCSCFFIGACDL
ncbi:unnamed protein product [Laminaria digitata]